MDYLYEFLGLTNALRVRAKGSVRVGNGAPFLVYFWSVVFFTKDFLFFSECTPRLKSADLWKGQNMIFRHFQTRFGVVLGGALVALNLSCASSNGSVEDPIGSSGADSPEATLEEGSLSEATVDESFSAAVDSSSRGPEAEVSAPTVEEPSPDRPKEFHLAPAGAMPEPAVLALNVPALDGQKPEAYPGAEGFTADSEGGAEPSVQQGVSQGAVSEAEVPLAAGEPPQAGEAASDQASTPGSKQRNGSMAPRKSGNAFVYTVKKGDWLSKVALKVYGPGGSWKEISEKNGLLDANRIQPGQKLILDVKNEASKKFSKAYGNMVFQKTSDYPSVQPNGLATIFAQPGDSLSKLAAAIYGAPGSWKAIYAMNQNAIADADLIFIKQKLRFRAEFPKETPSQEVSTH